MSGSKIKSDFNPNNYTYFKNTNGINNWGKEFNSFFKLKKQQIGALKSTKKDEYEIETYEYYAGYVSEKMNGLLILKIDFQYLYGRSPRLAFIFSLMRKRNKRIMSLKRLCCECSSHSPLFSDEAMLFFKLRLRHVK